MAEYIDRTEIFKGCSFIITENADAVIAVQNLLEHINSLPAADVVSKITYEATLKGLQALTDSDLTRVVRCKDCTYSKAKPIVGKLEEGEQAALLYCTMFNSGLHIYEDDYCSQGERRTDNE